MTQKKLDKANKIANEIRVAKGLIENLEKAKEDEKLALGFITNLIDCYKQHVAKLEEEFSEL